MVSRFSLPMSITAAIYRSGPLALNGILLDGAHTEGRGQPEIGQLSCLSHCQSDRMCTNDMGNTPFRSGCPSIWPICDRKQWGRVTRGYHNKLILQNSHKVGHAVDLVSNTDTPNIKTPVLHENGDPLDLVDSLTKPQAWYPLYVLTNHFWNSAEFPEETLSSCLH